MFHPFILEELFQTALPHTSFRCVAPRQTHRESHALLKRTEEGYTLKVTRSDLVGRDLEQVKLTVEDQLMTLEIPALDMPSVEGLTPLFEELPTGAYTGRYRLPRGIDLSLVEAKLNGEELLIKLPKRAPNRQTVQINIDEGSTSLTEH